MTPALDFRIFGNGFGFGAPYHDQAFYWLSGEFYTFIGGLGAQLSSVQWTHPKPGEVRKICGVEFRPFNSHRRWGRVMVSWATRLPHDLDEANAWIRQFKAHLGSPFRNFEYRPASADTRPQGGDAKQAPFTSGAVGEAGTPTTHHLSGSEGK
jgi:hypothetical protein